MQNLNNQAIAHLNQLMILVNEGRNGYALAAEKEGEGAVKNSFETFVKERDGYINDLKQIIYNMGGNVSDAFTPAALTRPKFMKLGAVSGEENKDALISACVNGEKAVIKKYKQALIDMELTEDTRQILLNHLDGLEYTVRKINSHLTPTF